MRLIDADALKKALKSNCKPELCHDYNTAWCESCCQTNDFEDLIDNAPTVEYTFEEAFQKTVCDNKLYCPARPKGAWVKEYKDIKCSNCGKIAYSWNCGGTYVQMKSEYCPHCGTKMIQENKE